MAINGKGREVGKGAVAPYELLDKIYFHWDFDLMNKY